MVYEERLTSKRTLALFAALTAFFGSLLIWRMSARGLCGWGIIFLVLAIIFLFYTINYRVLRIRLTDQTLTLNFGVFSWRIEAENIEICAQDQLPAFKQYGGAGIHFMVVDGRYRASFNFLEYPRIVIAFKHRVGPVQDISFSTRQPEKLLALIQQISIVGE